eukprot:749924-Hanusia_phi.AAC.4
MLSRREEGGKGWRTRLHGGLPIPFQHTHLFSSRFHGMTNRRPSLAGTVRDPIGNSSVWVSMTEPSPRGSSFKFKLRTSSEVQWRSGVRRYNRQAESARGTGLLPAHG